MRFIDQFARFPRMDELESLLFRVYRAVNENALAADASDTDTAALLAALRQLRETLSAE